MNDTHPHAPKPDSAQDSGQPQGIDQRQAARFDTEVDFCTLVTEQGNTILATLRNISRLGIRLESSFDTDFADVPKGSRVILTEFPEELSVAGPERSGEVVWTGPDEVGIRFDAGIECEDEVLARFAPSDGEVSLDEMLAACEEPIPAATSVTHPSGRADD